MTEPSQSNPKQPVVRYKDGQSSQGHDAVLVEEPLEIRIDCNPIAITMRTPGDDTSLALGFLLSEGLIGGVADVGRIVETSEDGSKLINVFPTESRLSAIAQAAIRRGTIISSSCGVCGRQQIDDLLERCPPIESEPRIKADRIVRAVHSLDSSQTLFSETGGAHCAAILSADLDQLAVAEDVGRHNAVDKAVGRMLQRDDVGSPTILATSSRGSFDIVQKAIVARIPIVVCVSAVSSLAIELAERAAVTLVGFARDERFTCYSHPRRVIE